MSKPGFFFYTGDWLKDTRALGLEARGAWIDLLCVLYEKGGSVTWPLRAYDQYLGTIEKDQLIYSASEIIDELEKLQICDVSRHSNGDITLTSRRITRDEKAKQSNAIRQTRHREKRKSNGPVTEKYIASSSSLSYSSSNSKIEDEIEPWRPIADEIFASDKPRFLKLVIWIKDSQKKGFSQEHIALALTAFRQVDKKTPVLDWYPYLTVLLRKESARSNGRAAEAEGESRKREERAWLKA